MGKAYVCASRVAEAYQTGAGINLIKFVLEMLADEWRFQMTNDKIQSKKKIIEKKYISLEAEMFPLSWNISWRHYEGVCGW